MDEFNWGGGPRCTSKAQAVGVVNSKGYGASNMYVVGSYNHIASPYGTYVITKPATSPPPALAVSSPWLDWRQLKRRKRIAKYKLYAVEGKVKNSFKKSIRWIKRTCGKIVHGL